MRGFSLYKKTGAMLAPVVGFLQYVDQPMVMPSMGRSK
jgi:hypothetical protein